MRSEKIPLAFLSGNGEAQLAVGQGNVWRCLARARRQSPTYMIFSGSACVGPLSATQIKTYPIWCMDYVWLIRDSGVARVTSGAIVASASEVV